MLVVRLLAGALLAGVITLALLAMMNSLISGQELKRKDTGNRKLIDIVMPERKITAQRKEVKPDKPDELEEPPPELVQPDMQDNNLDLDKTSISVKVKSDFDINLGSGFGAADGEYLPIAKIAPTYPRRALSRGKEGYCTVEYTVGKTGAVKNVRAIDCSPPNYFEKTSIAAAKKFKYKPRIIDGEPVEVAGVKNKFTYKLDQ